MWIENFLLNLYQKNDIITKNNEMLLSSKASNKKIICGIIQIVWIVRGKPHEKKKIIYIFFAIKIFKNK